MSLNTLKNSTTPTYLVDWLEFSSHLSILSKSLQTQNIDKIKQELIYCIYQNINIAKSYNIDLDKAWQKWNKKAKAKVYY
jgi:hypothetical protein